jgi:hypothetical protein
LTRCSSALGFAGLDEACLPAMLPPLAVSKPVLLINKQYNNTKTETHEPRLQNPMVCRRNSRIYFLEDPVFLPGGSGISSWRVRYWKQIGREQV